MSYRNFSGITAAEQAKTEPWIAQHSAPAGSAPPAQQVAPIPAAESAPVPEPILLPSSTTEPPAVKPPNPPMALPRQASSAPAGLSKLQQAALPAPSPQPAPRSPSQPGRPANFVSNYSRPRAATQAKQLLPSSTDSGISPLSKGIKP
jgi:hypothetical protein